MRTAWLDPALERLARIGCQVWGVAEATEAERALVPETERVVVVGSGGGALWSAFVDDLRAHPEHADLPDPLDAFVARTVAELPSPPGGRWVRCAFDEDLQPDFRTLALRAGLGHAGRLGLLMHPVHGPWLGLRVAAFTTERLEVTGPLPGRGPCVGCPAPCAPACPAGAMDGPRLDLDACLDHQRRHPTCEGGCLSREACVVGTASRYPRQAHRYHQHAEGRAAVLASVREP